MSIIKAILPIVIIITIPVIFLLFRPRVKFVTVKITHWFLIIYIGVLLLSMAAVPFISREMPRLDTDNKQALDKFNKALYKGKISQLNSKYIVSKKSFNYENPTLNIVSNRAGATILVERKASNDGEIEAIIFSNG